MYFDSKKYNNLDLSDSEKQQNGISILSDTPPFSIPKNQQERGGTPDASLYLVLADALGAEIKAGHLPSAVALNESVLAQVFNVSRTPARQALAALADQGLISALPKRGFVTGETVTTPDHRLADFPDRVAVLVRALTSAAQPSPLYEDIEKQITRLSVHGEWRVSIRAAQDFYRVSRTALEDVLRELEINGLVVRRPGGQWIALKMDCTRLEAIFDVRSWLEPKLLEQATIHIPMGVLDQAIADHEKALSSLPDVVGGELDRLETVLHHDLLGYAGNSPGLSALRSVKAGLVLSKHILTPDAIPVGCEDPFIEEHLGVLGALKRRRSEEGKLRVLAHLLESREKCASRLERYKDIARDTDCEFAKRIDQ